ncbi:DUF1549 domain-containing protein [Symmachiella dynata]|uniref:DUF1549 domain-containing protein n=1 Tax=Symmachiella dynata TaxID=2527995 RepID=UPI0030EC79EF
MMQRKADFDIPSALRRGCLTVVVLLGALSAARADDPLHVRIDRLIDETQIGPVAGDCTDAEFLRRVTLDLNGTIPTADEARAFLDDPSPDKRTALVDRALNRPRYARHLATVLDVMLMERRRDTHVKSPEWHKYLHDSVVANKPFNQLAREILSADGVDDAMRPAAKFYLDRLGEPHLLTRDVGRIFFGRDMQCAQCHDHPLIDDYLQDDYYGIFAFLQRGTLFVDKKAKKSFFAETADGEAVFTSVFTAVKGETGPRLPGQLIIDDPAIPAAEAYTVKPAKDVRPVPKYSRRAALAKHATDGTNRVFNRNIANRLWAHMMGRGLVEPVDLHHPSNPPVHPELLELLADEFVAMKFDMRAFLRELALTKTYRRGFDMPAELDTHSPEIESHLSRVTTDHTQRAAAVAVLEKEVDTLLDGVLAAQEAMFDVDSENTKAIAALAAVQKQSTATAKTLADSKQKLSKQEQALKVLNEALAKADEVVKQFPKDAEFTAAAETYRKRVKTSTDEIAALKTLIEKQTVAAKAAAEKTVAPASAAQAAADKLAAATQQVEQLRKPYLQKLYAYRDARTLVKHREQQLEHLKAILAYRQSTEKQQALVADVTTARNELTHVQTAALQAESEVETALAKVTTPQQRHTTALKNAQLIRAQHADKQKLARQVAEAATAGQAALALLPEDADLKSSTGQLAELAAQLNNDLSPLTEQLKLAEAKVAEAAAVLKAAQQELAAAQEKQQQAKQLTLDADAKLQAALQAQQTQTALVDNGFQDLTEQFAGRFATSALKPLTPEQLSWSIMQATGVVAQQSSAAVAKLDKKNPPAPPQRESLLEATVNEKLKGNVSLFVKTFGAGGGQPQNEFFATVDQALFFTNGKKIQSWLNPAGGNLTDRLKKLKDPAACAEELYLAIFSRRPTEQEATAVVEYLQVESETDQAAALQEIAWAMLTSAEFRFGH